MVDAWLKAFHVMAVISWMAGLLYLPRLFVYHAGVTPGSEASETFKVMERRLLKAIMNPAAVVSWGVGLTMAIRNDLFTQGWFHGKLGLAIVMTATHIALARWRNAFAEDRNIHSGRFYRMVNEVPTLLMIAIVILVFLRPF